MIKNILLATTTTFFVLSNAFADNRNIDKNVETLIPNIQKPMSNPLGSEKDNKAQNNQGRTVSNGLDGVMIDRENQEKLLELLHKDPILRKYVKDNVPDDVAADLGLLPQSKRIEQNNGQQITPRKANNQFLIFISSSLGEAALDQIFTALEGDEEIVAVLRGVKDPDNSGKELLAMQQKIAKYQKGLNLVINPKFFRDYQITTVPVIVKVDENGNEVARVAGMTNRDWLTENMKLHPETKDFGVRGPIEKIAERDLAEVLKEKAMAVDWESKKRKAIENVWMKYTFVELPHSAVPRTREIDLRIRSPQTIKDQYGNVLYKKGDLVNPLAVKHFDRAVLVFNPTYASEIKTVKKFLEKHKPDGRKTRLIVTHFDRKKGWKDYNALQEEFNAPIYVLNQDLKNTFKVEYTPSIIFAENGRLYIMEFGEELPKEEKALDWRAK